MDEYVTTKMLNEFALKMLNLQGDLVGQTGAAIGIALPVIIKKLQENKPLEAIEFLEAKEDEYDLKNETICSTVLAAIRFNLEPLLKDA